MTMDLSQKAGPSASIQLSGLGEKGTDKGLLQPVFETLGKLGYPMLPADQFYAETGEAGPKIERPLVKYRSAFLPCVETIMLYKWTRTAAGGLTLAKTVTSQIQLFSAGVEDPGTTVGAWFNLDSADTTLEKEGAPVYERHSYWAFGHTVAYEGLYRRGGNGTDITNPRTFMNQLDDGPGSYGELMLQAAAFGTSLTFQYQGDKCPRFMGTLASNPDRAQLIGGGRFSMANPELPFQRWARPSHFGAKDEFAKLQGNVVQSTDLEIDPIGGNTIPDDLTAVYQQFRVRLYGVRVCGNPEDGC